VVEGFALGPHLDAVCTEVVGHVEWERAGSDCVGDADLAAGAQHELAVELVSGHPPRDQLVHAELVQRDCLEPVELLHPRDLERPNEGVARAVVLGVEEGVGDGHRHLVPELGRADSVPVDQQVPHEAAS
jgi:hypothetical protein